MKHKILSTTDAHPYEIVTLELVAESTSEQNSISKVDDNVENYLTLRLNVTKVLEAAPPIFIVRRGKQNIGMG